MPAVFCALSPVVVCLRPCPLSGQSRSSVLYALTSPRLDSRLHLIIPRRTQLPSISLSLQSRLQRPPHYPPSLIILYILLGLAQLWRHHTPYPPQPPKGLLLSFLSLLPTTRPGSPALTPPPYPPRHPRPIHLHPQVLQQDGHPMHAQVLSFRPALEHRRT